jgi:hypothetical protein
VDQPTFTGYEVLLKCQLLPQSDTGLTDSATLAANSRPAGDALTLRRWLYCV